MQTLRSRDKLVKLTIDLAMAFRGEGIIKKILFISHRWEEKWAPDVRGEQLKAIQKYLLAHPEIEFVWFDYSCMPQKENAEVDGRSTIEKKEFDLMLGAISDLYLTAPVLILLDNNYVGRFWTMTEAWCSMMSATKDGIHPTVDAECRYTIECIGNASAKFDVPKLKEELGAKTPAQMHTFLSSIDIIVTNAKDKEITLPIIANMDRHVKIMLEEMDVLSA